jgi:hypothetical protein
MSPTVTRKLSVSFVRFRAPLPAIDIAPAKSPAIPVNNIVSLETAAPATPMTKLILETNPSLEPKTAARKAFPPRIYDDFQI